MAWKVRERKEGRILGYSYSGAHTGKYISHYTHTDIYVYILMCVCIYVAIVNIY